MFVKIRIAILLPLYFLLSACGLFKTDIHFEMEATHRGGQVFQESGPLAAPYGAISWLKGTRFYFDVENVSDEELNTTPYQIAFFDNYEGRYSTLEGQLIDFQYDLLSKEIHNFSEKCMYGEGSYSIYKVQFASETRTLEIQHINGQCEGHFNNTASCFAISILEPQEDICIEETQICTPQEDKRTNTRYYEKTSGGCTEVKDFLDKN